VRRRAAAAPAGILLAAALLLTPAAEAANRRISISDYRWSRSSVEIDRGEHVTWHWIGPDTMHSVTGISPNADGLDSDPDDDQPRHNVGDAYRLDFDDPGTYTFQCKLHTLVRGTVVVSSNPGDPVTEVDPVPRSNVDLRPPHVSDVGLRARSFRRGTTLRFGIDEAAKVEVDYYRRQPRGERRVPRYQRFVGFQRWRAHIGFNDVPFSKRAEHFRPRPGAYLAILRATDPSNNESAAKQLRFRIRG